MPMARAADLASISRSTLYKVERGDPVEQLEGLVDARWDRSGLALEESRLPRRIRKPDV